MFKSLEPVKILAVYLNVHLISSNCISWFIMMKGHWSMVDDVMIRTTAILAFVDDGVWRWLGSRLGHRAKKEHRANSPSLKIKRPLNDDSADEAAQHDRDHHHHLATIV